MTLASFLRPHAAPTGVPGGRHAAPGGEIARVVAVRTGPGRHAAREDLVADDEVDDADGDLLDALGFDYADA